MIDVSVELISREEMLLESSGMVLLEVEDSIGISSGIFSKESISELELFVLCISSPNAVPQYDEDNEAGVITPEESKIIINP